MDRALHVQLTAIKNEIQAAAIPDACRETAHWYIGQLPALYSKFRQTNESRYGEEITRLVHGVLKELAEGMAAGPERQKRKMSIPDRLQRFHEEFGLPELNIKPAVV